MKTIDTSLSTLIQKYGEEAQLHSLPEFEFERGRAIANALGRDGRDESAHKVISDIGLWDSTLAQFAKMFP